VDGVDIVDGVDWEDSDAAALDRAAGAGAPEGAGRNIALRREVFCRLTLVAFYAFSVAKSPQ